MKHVGDYFGFGSTEEEFRWQNLGCKAKGLKDGPALNHSTGKGWVDGFSAPNPAATSLQRQAGADYHDAIYVKNNRVYLWVCEGFGGICPAADAELKRLGRMPATTRDGTMYGTNPQAPRCFRTHHLQRISTGIVMADAAHILAEASKVKINMANRRFGQDITSTAQKA